MTRTCWRAAPDGRYWIDVVLGVTPCRLMIDTGLVDAAGKVGFELSPTLFDQVKNAGPFVPGRAKPRRDSAGRTTYLPSGLVAARLIDPATGQPISPSAACLVLRNTAAGVPSRVGVAFFHALAGCRVDWDLTAHLWCVECP